MCLKAALTGRGPKRPDRVGKRPSQEENGTSFFKGESHGIPFW
jgi:hypothetical protein